MLRPPPAALRWSGKATVLSPPAAVRRTSAPSAIRSALGRHFSRDFDIISRKTGFFEVPKTGATAQYQREL
jgi:hypothetical protein